TAALGVGLHTIRAVYSPNGAFAGSSASVTQTVGRAPTTLAGNPSIARLDRLQPRVYLTLSARLRTDVGQPVPDQVVAFSAGGRYVCAAVTDPEGLATCGGVVPGEL